MDLSSKLKTARHTLSQAVFCIGALLLLWANTSQGKAGNPGRDYLFAEESRGGRIVTLSQTQTTQPSRKLSASIQYQAFDGSFHNLVQHHGRHVSVLLPATPDTEEFFTPDHIEEMLDRLDMLYVLYKELLRFEPAGAGPLKVAFIPETCGMGCGLIGSKGIEILSEPSNYRNIIRELDAGRLDTILVHEMVHNFDGYYRYLHYLPDHAHAWTDMFEYFAPYRYARATLNNESPDDIFNSPVRSVWKQYIADEKADWKTCVRDQACEESGLTANNLWAMLYYRIESMHGVDALLESFNFIADYAGLNPPPRTELEKEGLRILSLSVGAGVNLACYVDSLKWPLLSEVRTELNQRFGDASQYCSDMDQDGLSAVNGDCDDQDPNRNIFSPENAGNGYDDDCDDLVDEEALFESDHGIDPDNFLAPVQTSLPFEVEGSASDSEDRDTFGFSLKPSGRARVTLCARNGFIGWAAAQKPGGVFLETPGWFIYQPGGGCSSSTFDYGSSEHGEIVVIPDETRGEYALTVSEAAELPRDISAFLQVEPRQAGGVSLQFDDREGYLAKLGADEMEFWISGAGVQFFQPFRARMTIHLKPESFPQLANGSLYQVRIRPRAGGKPLAAFSAGQLFRYNRKSSESLAIDNRFSGTWFDPEHEGEGFVVEVHDDGNALVYWFTYQADGKQRWLLGTGTIVEQRLLVERMVDARGGRFGDDFDPGDVSLKVRGSLSISFLSCSRALVNYSIDNNGGHQDLQRLTHVAGHDCGGTQARPEQELSGSWYDPAHDGEGFVFEQLDAEQALVYWFTYDASGNQAWLINTGTVDNGRIIFPELVQPQGGKFGRSFDPSDITRPSWGELILELDCAAGSASYQPEADGFSNGTQILEPLTRLQNSNCH